MTGGSRLRRSLASGRSQLQPGRGQRPCPCGTEVGPREVVSLGLSIPADSVASVPTVQAVLRSEHRAGLMRDTG